MRMPKKKKSKSGRKRGERGEKGSEVTLIGCVFVDTTPTCTHAGAHFTRACPC